MILKYRPGEGKSTRGVTYLVYLLLTFLLCSMIYDMLPLGSSLNNLIFSVAIFGIVINVTIWFLASVLIFIAVAIIGIKILNIQKISDFLIETEGELKKVSWPKRNEYVSASIAIFFMLIFTVFYLLLVDEGLTKLMDLTSGLLGVRIGF